MAPKVASPTTYRFDLFGTSDKDPMMTEFAKATFEAILVHCEDVIATFDTDVILPY